MKNYKIVKITLMTCLILGIFLIPIKPLKVQAEEIIATVHGTILSGTTSELLKLSTKEGNMDIKLNSGTDTSTCKILLPDNKIYVSVSHGSDGFLHAVRITGDAQSPGVSLDTSTTATVSGTIGDKSKSDIIYLNTAQGEMQIKLDTTTSLGGCSVLVMGKNYNVSCARGTDAYMHAISITDPAGTVINNTANAANAATMSVTGTVVDKTKENLLYLSTKGGEMQFVIDANADTSKGMVLTPGNQLTVSFYHGSDGYLHAVGIVGVKDNPNTVEIDTSNTATVSGTVEGNSNQNILYLQTSGGRMELKLDKVSSTNCKVLISGKKVNVTCARGSDAYMHAISIMSAAGTGVNSTVTNNVNNISTMSVTGTVADKTKESLLYLSTKEGEMQFKIDANADTSSGMVLTPGNKLTVSFYHGSDGYLHTTGIVGNKDSSSSVEIDASTSVTVSGTVESNSNQNILYLKTTGGRMELKLDKVSSNNCKVLISGKKLTVTCARGSDAYMHAINISG